MKNILTIIFLFSSVCLAEWETVMDDEVGALYLDKESVEKNNDSIYIWMLMDFKTKQKLEDRYDSDIYTQLAIGLYGDIEYTSETSLVEFNCGNTPKRIRNITSHFYSNNMGTGEMVHQDSNESDWEYPSPGTILSELMEVCTW